MPAPIRSPHVQGLNLRGELPPAEEQPESLPGEPLGLDLIRGWLKKPRPRLYSLWLWVPYIAEGIRDAYGWLRTNTGPALRRTARTLRNAAKVIQEMRGIADRLAGQLQRAFPPGSRGREVAALLATGSRLFGRSVLVLVGIGREADRIPSILDNERAPGTRPPTPERLPSGAGPRPAPGTPPPAAPGEPAASLGPSEEPACSGAPEEPAASQGPPEEPVASPGPPDEPAASPDPPEEPVRSPDLPEESTPSSAPAEPSPVPGVPPGPRAEALAELSDNLRVQILTLGKRPRKAALRFTIWRTLNERGPATSETLGLLLQIDPENLAKRHLSPLVEEGVLERTIPDRITHPEQAYRSTRWPPGADGAPATGK